MYHGDTLLGFQLGQQAFYNMLALKATEDKLFLKALYYFCGIVLNLLLSEPTLNPGNLNGFPFKVDQHLITSDSSPPPSQGSARPDRATMNSYTLKCYNRLKLLCCYPFSSIVYSQPRRYRDHFRTLVSSPLLKTLQGSSISLRVKAPRPAMVYSLNSTPTLPLWPLSLAHTT